MKKSNHNSKFQKNQSKYSHKWKNPITIRSSKKSVNQSKSQMKKSNHNLKFQKINQNKIENEKSNQSLKFQKKIFRQNSIMND